MIGEPERELYWGGRDGEGRGDRVDCSMLFRMQLLDSALVVASASVLEFGSWAVEMLTSPTVSSVRSGGCKSEKRADPR